MFAAAAIGQIVLAVPAFWLLDQKPLWAPIIACVVLGVLLAGFAAPSAATLPALFPTIVRYGALSIGFNVAVSAFGGTTPLVTSALVTASGNHLMPGFYLIASGVVGLIAVLFLRETATAPLAGSPPQVDDADEATRLYAEAKEAVAETR